MCSRTSRRDSGNKRQNVLLRYNLSLSIQSLHLHARFTVCLRTPHRFRVHYLNYFLNYLNLLPDLLLTFWIFTDRLPQLETSKTELKCRVWPNSYRCLVGTPAVLRPTLSVPRSLLRTRPNNVAHECTQWKWPPITTPGVAYFTSDCNFSRPIKIRL